VDEWRVVRPIVVEGPSITAALFPSTRSNVTLRQQHGDEDLPPCCCCPRYGSTLVKPPPTPTPMLLETPPVMAAPLPKETAPLVELL